MSKSNNIKPTNASQVTFTSSRIYDDDDDFQTPIQSLPLTKTKPTSSHKLKPSNTHINRPSKKLKKTQSCPGKENFTNPLDSDLGLGLDFIEPSVLCNKVKDDDVGVSVDDGFGCLLNLDESRLLVRSKGGCRPSVYENVCEKQEVGSAHLTVRCGKVRVEDGVSVMGDGKKMKVKDGFSYFSNSIESRLLLRLKGDCRPSVCENFCEKVGVDAEERFEDCHEAGNTQLDVLLDLCCEDNEIESGGEFISCPMCGADISNMSDEMKQVHTNECLDKEVVHDHIDIPDSNQGLELSGQVLDEPHCLDPGQTHHISPISVWLKYLDLSRYEEVFIREEIDWDSLKWLTDEDLCKMGISALGPRKKIVHAISELRTEGSKEVNIPEKVTHKETKTVSKNSSRIFFLVFLEKRQKVALPGHKLEKLTQVMETNAM